MHRSLLTPFLIVFMSALPGAALAQPASPPADWSFEPNVVGERLGGWVAGAGDVNGDGYDDILVSAPESSGTYARDGKVYLFLGSPAGPGASPDRTWTGSEPYAALVAFAGAGDLDGDGFDEVLLSDGRLYRGSAGGPAAAPVLTAIRGRFAAGDINDDGYGDLVVASSGRADVYLGSPAGLSAAASQSIVIDRLNWDVGRGPVLADVTGDGYDDLVMASFDLPRRVTDPSVGSSSLHFFEGGPSGLADREMRSPNLPRGELRVALGDAGDLNADGYADLVLGLRVDGAGSYFGPLPVLESDGWKSGLRNGREILPDSSVVTKMIAGAGDVDGDGYDDALVGLYDSGVPGQTLLLLFHGSTDGLASAPRIVWAEVTFGSPNDYYSESACGAGDVNGDGYADVLVGSPRFGSGEAGEGHVLIYLGGPGL